MAGSGPSAGVVGGSADAWYFTREQLAASPSRRCGLDADKELSYRQQAANLIQDMGQRLQVSQLCINTAIVYMHRFYAFHSFTHFHRNSIAAAALFLAAKVEEQPRKLEYVIKVAHVCLHRGESAAGLDPRSEHYQEQAQDLVFNENVLLQTLGFDVAIDHPHTHVVRTCHLVKAPKDLAQTSYFMASNSLHLTTMCLQYKPTVVACFCIHLASKWSNWAIPQSNEGKHWFSYVDGSVTTELLERLTAEFLHIFDKCPSRLKRKMMSISGNSGSPQSGMPAPGSSQQAVKSSPYDTKKAQPHDDMEKSFEREYEREKSRRLAPGGYSTAPVQATLQPQKMDVREYREKKEREERERRQLLQQQQARASQSRPERPEGRPDRPERPEVRADRPESRSDRPESRPDRPESRPDRPESRPDRPESRPERPESRPERPESRPERPDSRPERPESRPDRQESRPDRPDRPEVRPDQRISSHPSHHQRSANHHKPPPWPHQKPPHHKPHEQRSHHRPTERPPQAKEVPPVAAAPVQPDPPAQQRTRPPSLFSPESTTPAVVSAAVARSTRAPPPAQPRRPQPTNAQQVVREMQPPRAVSPLSSPPPPPQKRQRTSSSTGHEPELVPVVKKLEETPGYENLMRAAAARRAAPPAVRAASPPRPANGIETDPALVSSLLKESLVRPVTITPPADKPLSRPAPPRAPLAQPAQPQLAPQPLPVAVEPATVAQPTPVAAADAPTEHRHRSEKKKKKEKHKHKDRDKPREERKKHKKDKDKEKKREEATAADTVDASLRMTIPTLPSPQGLKIKIPKERLAAPPPTPPGSRAMSTPAPEPSPQQPSQQPQPQQPSHQPPQHQQWQPQQQSQHASGIKIKIPKEVLETSRKRQLEGASSGVSPQKQFRQNNGVPHKAMEGPRLHKRPPEGVPPGVPPHKQFRHNGVPKVEAHTHNGLNK